MKRILLIDDDEDMLAMTERWLEKGGYEVVKAVSGKEALDILNHQKPDLILLDYAMPEMNGPEVLAAIRSNNDTKNIPVLYRTGMDDTDFYGDENCKPDAVASKSEGRPILMKAVESILG